MLVWQMVEHNLFAVFFSLFDAPVIMQTSAVYYSQESFGAKLRVVDATARVVSNKDRLARWEKLHRRLKAAAQHRNVLAHHTAVAEFFPDNSFSLVMAPAMLIPEPLKRSRGVKYDTAQCQRLQNEFEALAGDLSAFIEPNAFVAASQS
jgi:hypothetical protein